jgi:hypothetical protein
MGFYYQTHQLLLTLHISLEMFRMVLVAIGKELRQQDSVNFKQEIK